MPKGAPEGYRRAGATGGGSMGASGGGRGGGKGSGSRPLLPKGSSFRATPKPSKSSTSQQPKSPQTKYGVKTGMMRSSSSQQSKQASANWKGVKSGTRGAKAPSPQPKPTSQQKSSTQPKPTSQKPSTSRPDRSGVKGAAVGAGAAALMGATGLLLTKAAQEKKNPPSSPSAPSKVKPQQGMRKTLGGVRSIYDKGRWIPLADYIRKTQRS